jgi:hypothetical protein
MKLRAARRACVAALAFALSGTSLHAAPAPSPTPPTEKPTRTIAILINGEALEGEAPAQVVGGRVLVPLRAVFGALGVGVQRVGKTITARLPTGSASVTVGSAEAAVNGNPVELDAAVVDREGTTFVPLRFVAASLGAQASYDQLGAKVEIVSAYIGRATGAEQARAGGGTNVQGVVSAVDADSAPPSVTVVQGGVSRTINITSDAKIFIEDATIHSQVKGTLDDVHVGDALFAVLTAQGRVVEVHDFFKSLSGTISAVSPIAIVLGNGRVVQPEKATDISLNGNPAQLADLHVGDFVTVRSNPETGELRQIVASRSAQAAATALPAASPSSVVITDFTIDATRPLRAGESLNVTLRGTVGGRASFDIADYVTGVEMHETQPGTYTGQFVVPERFNVTQVPVYGHLTYGAGSAPRAEAPTQLSAATTPPSVGEVAPPPGQTVNNSRPSIYATFVAPTEIAINPSSVTLVVNGHDVTSSATRTNSFITYSPGIDYPDGEVTVVVRVSDAAGNSTTRTWTFFIKTK